MMTPSARKDTQATTARRLGFDKRGFTLVETLMALMILVLMTGIVAMGVPAAFRSYTNAVNAANAQVLISTASTALRDELGSAQMIWQAGNNVYYKNSEGILTQLRADGETGKKLPTIQKHFYKSLTSDLGSDPTSNLVPAGDPSKLVTDAAVTDALGLRFDSITYANGVVTIKNLCVVDADGNKIVGTGSDPANCVFKIPAVMSEES